MTIITIFGTGKMGAAIAALAGRASAQVQSISHREAVRKIAGDIVVLAVPYPALVGIADQYRDQLAGKTVVDITNPVDFATFSPLSIPAGSAAQELAQSLPNSRVVKAFNTNFAGTVATGTVGNGPTLVLIAGDNAEAKTAVIDMVTRSGALGVDAGPLTRAHQLEGLGLLQMGLAASGGLPWTGGLTLAT
jgi:8-hydroxy-5-deazaflavin:NADPH oxidoreductase